MEQVLRYIEGTHNIAFTQLTPSDGDTENFWALVGSGKDTTFTIVSKAKCGKNYETFLFENKNYNKEHLNCCLCGGRFTHVQYYSLCNVCAPFHAHSQNYSCALLIVNSLIIRLSIIIYSIQMKRC